MTEAHRLRCPDVVFRPIQRGRLARIPQAEQRVVANDEELLPERALLLQHELDAHCLGLRNCPDVFPREACQR